MKFNYIPILPLIAEISSELKTFQAEGRIDEDECYSSAVECMREIGGNSYDTYPLILDCTKINVHRLPPDFYIMEEAWELREFGQECDIFNISDAFKETTRHYRRDTAIYPGNSATLVSVHRGSHRVIGGSFTTYVIKKRPALIVFSGKGFTAGLIYHGFARDTDGSVMVQDEINTIKCIKNYVKMMLLQQDYILGRIPQYVYNEFKNEYAIYLGQAQAIQIMPDTADMNKQIQSNEARFNQF